MEKIIQRINSVRSNLTQNDLDIISIILKNFHQISESSINEISLLTHSSQSTLVRLSQKLGFSGFSELRYFLKNSLTHEQNNVKNMVPNSELLKNDINHTLQLIEQLDLNSIVHKIKAAKKIYIFGTGWGENNAASDLIRNFLSCGIFILQFPSITELKWNQHLISNDDLMIVISFSGENNELIDIVDGLRIRGVNICSITPLHQNRLSQSANLNLYYQYTDLNIQTSNNDYNLFVTLYIVTDALFRKYLDEITPET